MRSIMLAALLVPMSLVACGGGSSGDDTQPVPTGTHTHFVVNTVSVPTTNNEATEFGLDIGASKTSKPDGAVDNQLGHVLAALKGQGFDVKTTLDKAVNEGSIILLADFQATSLTSASAAGLQVLLGANPSPAPCAGSADTTCGHHLDGTGMFSIAADSPTDALVSGPIVNGTFTGGPGTIELQLALGGTTPVNLSLQNARAKATGISDTGITSLIIGGALSKSDLDTQVIPAIVAQLGPIITRDCTTTTPPDCGCMAGSTGKTILGLFDTAPQDCVVTNDEVLNNTLIKSLLAPDVCTMASCAAPDALSLGIKVTAVKGTYTVAGE